MPGKFSFTFSRYDIQEDWSVFLATKRRVMKLKMTEFDEEFNSASTGDNAVSIIVIRKEPREA